MSEVCIRRKKDGLFYIGKTRGFASAPKFLPSEAKAHVVIRVDLGADLAEYDVLTRKALANPSGSEQR